MTNLLPYITGSAGALVVLALIAWAFYTGHLHSDREFSRLEQEKDEYKAALQDERTAVDEQTKAGTVTNQLIGALAGLASERRYSPAQARPRRSKAAKPASDADLTPEDVGL
jgi:hypothetical protein